MSPREKKHAAKLTKIFQQIYEIMRDEEDEPRAEIDLHLLDAKIMDAVAELSELTAVDMRMKTIIRVSGRANCGKTDTIRKVFDSLMKTNPVPHWDEFHHGKDVSGTLTIDRDKIGIESQGDPNDRLEKSLRRFVASNCLVILCATRTKARGCKNYFLVEKLGRNGYHLKPFDKKFSATEADEEIDNKKMAREIVKIILAVLAS